MNSSSDEKLELSNVPGKIWECLRAGAGAGKAPFSVLQAATVGVEGDPRVRTIVLREADETRARLSFHTDLRSEKVRELRERLAISLLGYDPERLVQIRLEGSTSFAVDDTEKLAVWNSSRPRTLILYRSPIASGQSIDDPSHAAPAASDDPMSGYDNFCLVHVTVHRMEYLDLSCEPHQRARFIVRDGGTVEGNWIAP